ncbi:MAG: serine/threonine-protein kinase [Lysobacteraceae bacterium]
MSAEGDAEAAGIAQTQRIAPKPELVAASFASMRPGARIADYVVESLIAHGGMGAVYRAQQVHPVQRVVALKVLDVTLGSHEQERLFARETQALASMQHPGIAQLYAAGKSSEGRPWFAMEWVDGEPMDVFLAAHPLSVAERVQLLRDTALAVAHAHQRGVVHCDLKPANLLVTTVDERPTVKLVDFGIAQSVMAGQRAGVSGTPAYMSPEQFDPNCRLDARSDVFALGVIAWEALIGKRFRRIDGQASPSLETAIQAGWAMPELPPVDLQIGGTSRQRSRELLTLLRSALAHEADDRLGSAMAFADDLGRWLQNAPLHAMPARRTYRWQCFMRRHGVLVGLSVFAAVVIFGLLLALYSQLRIAERERDVANQSLQMLVDTFRAADPYTHPGGSISVRALLQSGVRRLDLDAVPVQARLRLLETLGEVQFALEIYDDATETFDLAAQAADAAGMADAALDARLQAARALAYGEDFDAAQQRLSALQEPEGGDLAFEASLLQVEIDLQLDELTDAGTSLEILGSQLPRVGLAMQQQFHLMQGRLLVLKGDHQEATQPLQQSVRLAESLWGPDDHRTLAAQSDLASVLVRMGALDEAEPLRRSIAAATERTFGGDSVGLAIDLDNLGVLLGKRGRESDWREAEGLHRRALDIFRRHAGDSSLHTGTSANNLAAALDAQGRASEAEAWHVLSLRSLSAVLGDAHSLVGIARHNFARNLIQRGEYVAAAESLAMAESILRATLGVEHPRWAVLLVTRCELALAEGRQQQARMACDQAWDRLRAAPAGQQVERDRLLALRRRLP